MSSVGARAIIERWYHEVLSGGQIEVIDEIFDPAYVAYHMRQVAGGRVPPEASDITGIKQEAKRFRSRFSKPVFFPALLATPAPLAPQEGDVVAFDVSMSAVDQHGRPFREHGIEIWVVAGGRIRCSADT